MRLKETVFVVVDTETTGLQIGTDRMTELAAVKVIGGRIVERFTQLVNPERHIPRQIAHMTGITTEAVFDAPTAAEVLPDFMDFLGDAVLVAHNLSFDQKVLDMELTRANMEPLSNASLCTLRLARRLLTALPSKSLKSLKNHYGIRTARSHRALDDAEATAKILERLLFVLDFDHKINMLDDLLAYQYQRYDTERQPKHVHVIRESVLPELPDRAGVYFFKDGKGNILYIGKAKSLRMRVRSYFSAIEAHPSRTKQLVKSMRGLEWQETGSELGALLLESKLIKTHKPRFNRADIRYRNRPFIRLDGGHDFPDVSWRFEVHNDSATYFGPLPRRQHAEQLVELINRMFKLRQCDDRTFATGPCLYAQIDRCLAPCVGGEGAIRYRQEVERITNFLLGRDETIIPRMQVAMMEAAERMEYEEAKWYRDQIQFLERILKKQKFIAAPVLDHNAVWIQPGSEAGTMQCFLVRFGRLVDSHSIRTQPDGDEINRLKQQLARHFDPELPLPERYRREEVDEVRILANWIYAQRDTARQVAWSVDQDVDAFAERIVNRLVDGGEGIGARG
jgi:DNA polymerase-3 subunit epsilon